MAGDSSYAAPRTVRDAFPEPAPVVDPAWGPPRDPLASRNVDPSVIRREIPMGVAQTGWTVPDVRNAMVGLTRGWFDKPAQLVDAVMADSRVQAAMASRGGGILGRPVDFAIPKRHRDSDLAAECRDAFVSAWPTISPEPALSEIQQWGVMLGLGPAQLLWDTGGEYATPHPRPWHPRFSYYHWTYRCTVAVTMDSQVPIIPGDGQWVMYAPHGEHRGWMRGAVRALAPWWLARLYALRDWARYSELHGMGILLALTPASADPKMIEAFRDAVSRMGQETTIQLPQQTDKSASFGLDLLEAKANGWEGFSRLISQCDMEIVLALLAQNLTTEIKEGSMAAARVHADVRQVLVEADARALAMTIYNQIARPFAALNFGNADLAPMVRWNVKPYEDDLTAVQTLAAFAQALLALQGAGVEVDDPRRLASNFGLDLGRLNMVDPLTLKVANAKTPTAPAGGAGARVRIATGSSERADAVRFDPSWGGYTGQRLRIVDSGEDAMAADEALAMAELADEERRSRVNLRTQRVDPSLGAASMRDWR